MKKFILIILAFFLCSQICFAEERTITLILKDGSEVSGEDLGSSNGVFKVRTDSGIVVVKSNDVEEISEEVKFSWDDLGINREDADDALEKMYDEIENNSYNQNDYYENESNNSNYQDDNYKQESNDSDYQNDSYDEESNYKNEDQ